MDKILSDTKTLKSQKDNFNEEETKIKFRLFLFYSEILKKKQVNILITSILLIIETIQMVSYAFTQPLVSLWELSPSTEDYLKKIIGAPRITPLYYYLNFNEYLIIWIILVSAFFIYILFFATVLQINKTNSKIYRFFVVLSRYLFYISPIVLVIPSLETVFLMGNCNAEKKFDWVKNGIQCFSGIHFLYFTISIIYGIVFVIFMFLNQFYVYAPFENYKQVLKVNTYAETVNFAYKFIIIVIYCIGINKKLTTAVYFLGSLYVTTISFSHRIYNTTLLNALVNFRNCSVLWTYFTLLLNSITTTKFFSNTIYLEILGYPLIIFLSNSLSRNNLLMEIGDLTKTANEFEFLKAIKKLTYIISNTLNHSKHNKKKKKCEILLTGYINFHEKICLNEECPLKSFATNSTEIGSRNCLLNYMNILYNEGMKKFSSSRMILLHLIHFNYQNKYNLNVAKVLIGRVESMNKSLREEFLLYLIKKNISIRNESSSGNEEKKNDSEENDIVEVDIEEKLNRLKFLIEESAKMFSDFWGNLATNLTVNLNLPKIFFLGKKLNSNINEIHNLWENDLKHQKVDFNNIYIFQLYAYFLRKVLRDKRASDEIAKKLNEEQYFDYSKKIDDNKVDYDNLEKYIENPDIVCFCTVNEKGECDIIQCSNSFVYLSGYSKIDVIGKNIEFLMPNLYTENNGHMKMLAERIKQAKTSLILHKNSFERRQCNQSTLKLKNGFILPVVIRFTYYSENDFGNSFFIKAKFELKDTKTIYPFYILTRPDFTIENVSSSGIIYGITQELLKKNIIDLNILIRNDHYQSINFASSFREYEEEPRPVFWVYPDKIYSKAESIVSTEKNADKIIEASKRKLVNLTISVIKYREDEVIGYLFKLLEPKDAKKENYQELFDFSCSKKYNMVYSMQAFNYVRTKIVNYKEKELLERRCSKSNNFNGEETMNETLSHVESHFHKESKFMVKKDKIKQSSLLLNTNYSDFEEEEKSKNESLSKELINKLQAASTEEIQRKINALQFYGEGISLEKFRPNKEKYLASKCTEPEIKISLATFVKRMDDKKIKIPKKDKQKGKLSSSLSLSAPKKHTSNESLQANNFKEGTTDLGHSLSVHSSHDKQNEVNEMNGILDKYVNSNSSRNISIFSFVIFVLNFLLLIGDFTLGMYYISQFNSHFQEADQSYNLLNDLMYIKYFITEAVLAQDPNYPNTNFTNSTEYIYDMMSEMSDYRSYILQHYNYLNSVSLRKSSKFSEYINNISFNILTFNNNLTISEKTSYSIAMERLITNIFYVSTINDNYYQINMNYRNTYELMNNILNDYSIIWFNITNIIFEELNNHNSSYKAFVFLLIFSIVAQGILFGVLFKLLHAFKGDREKPLDLFLTIKKQKFEQLKEASELFLNRLLNKLFGNDEIEQETTSQASIFPSQDDIVITKLKNKNSYNKSSSLTGDYLLSYIRLIFFIIILEIYLGIKYYNFQGAVDTLIFHSKILNVTEYSRYEMIKKTNVIKSYLFDPNIPLFNQINTTEVIISEEKSLTSSFNELIIQTYDKKCFDGYDEIFFKGMVQDISNLVPLQLIRYQSVESLLIKGFKRVSIKYFEFLRSLWLLRLKYSSSLPVDNLLYLDEFGQINEIIRNIIRPWFETMMEELTREYEKYIDNQQLTQICCVICMGFLLIIVYIFFWRRYEETLKESLQTSVQLLNLLPLELKRQIIKNILTEEEELENSQR